MEICTKRYKRKVLKLKYKRLDNNRIKFLKEYIKVSIKNKNTLRYKNSTGTRMIKDGED